MRDLLSGGANFNMRDLMSGGASFIMRDLLSGGANPNLIQLVELDMLLVPSINFSFPVSSVFYRAWSV